MFRLKHQGTEDAKTSHVPFFHKFALLHAPGWIPKKAARRKNDRRRKMTEKNDVAERLGKIREALNLKQKDMAKRLNISQTTYSEFESGKHMPKFEVIYHLARELNVNLYYFMFGKGDMFLGPTQLLSRSLGKNVVKKEEIESFLHYFEHSNIAQLQVLASFMVILQRDKESIEKEIAENLSKK